MWTQAQLVEDLQNIGLTAGSNVLVHSSLRAVGQIEGGAETLLQAFKDVIGTEGTLLVPTFTFAHSDPAGWRDAPRTSDALREMREMVPVFDAATSPTMTRWLGVFPEIVRRQPEAKRSNHPVVSFAALGANAEFLTQNAPFHYPLGSESPLARLHQLDGYVMLIGVPHTVNTSLHLAEVWSQVPYIHRTATLKTASDDWTVMLGSPECSDGFGKIEPLLRQSRLLRHGYIGNAPSQLMRQRGAVSMAVALLQGDGSILLCDNPDCLWCPTARKFTAEQMLSF